LKVNKNSLAFLLSVLVGKITAAPTHPAARLIKKSEKIPKAILSINPLYHIFNGQIDDVKTFRRSHKVLEQSERFLYNGGSAIRYGPVTGSP